ncbi:MAG: (d)CMP kinase [Balneolaceae bacterium]|nr:(d)CMP kinase [Balneolaceae bacterium]
MIIVIDGPAGSGKSSTAKAVARKLGIEYLDSGALYRALTVVYVSKEWSESSFFEFLSTLSISFSYDDELFRVWIDDKEITDKLRSEEVSNNVSEVASKPKARTFVNNLMRNAVETGNYIAEGRDLGTAVFPDAKLKFFMSADINERARRRHQELIKQGQKTTLGSVKQNIEKRDKIDSQRNNDPLKKADDAIDIDTTDLTFEQQVQKICSLINKRLTLN